MKMTPAYADLDEVVTENRINDMVDGLSKQFIKQGHYKDAAESTLAARTAIWQLDNPFQWLYDNIKKYHPETQKQKEKQAAPSTPGAKKEPPKVPSSIADLGSGGSAEGEWTAKRIDDLPEEELKEVPKNVYQKYMRGELD